MKKTQKPLRLSRETLNLLAGSQLAQAEGGKFPPLDPQTNWLSCWCA